MDKIKVSIITVTYNAEDTLEECISSVINQDYDNIEYIIIDGDSKDDTVNIIKKYDEFIDTWISENDEGIYDAMNKGISVATGDYIEFLGADDALVSTNIITEIIEHLEDDIDILSTSIYAVNKYARQKKMTNFFARDREKYTGGMIPHGGMFVKKCVFDKYRFDTKYRSSSDYKFFLQCYFDDNIKFKFIDIPCVFFAMDGISSNNELAADEDFMIHNELDLGDLSTYEVSNMRQVINILKKNIIVKLIYRFLCRNCIGEKHTCKNMYCRWCGR